ncbi:hypothetical protein K788_0006605 [Paraburkholderia caribensis MBA4]|uniref:Uncharacterized protein n=1 Tax=Paraburkholderia caribensis MBA4 TaxID=1323664 RepID=A0A0P0R8G8_9BURK|nr:hypothetical protein K788_0006605 [Paraburkholderia caribensis MBA4]
MRNRRAPAGTAASTFIQPASRRASQRSSGGVCFRIRSHTLRRFVY